MYEGKNIRGTDKENVHDTLTLVRPVFHYPGRLTRTDREKEKDRERTMPTNCVPSYISGGDHTQQGVGGVILH